MHGGREQVIAALFLNETAAVPILRGIVRHSWSLQVCVDRAGDGVGDAPNSEGCHTGLRMFRRQRLNLGKSLCQRIRYFPGMPAYPDSRTADTTTAAVQKDAVEHQIEMLLPIVNLVVSQQDF